MSHFHDIYRSQAEAYDRLVAAEDCDGRLGPALAAVLPLAGGRVLDVGTGTGRVAALLEGAGARVVACDAAPAMIARAAGRGLTCLLADATALPVASGAFDAATAGWVFGHFCEWCGESWADALDAALAEMARAVRPGGALALLETLGTGADEPGSPTAELGRYYRRLEALGFSRQVVVTDYRFADVEEAARTCGWFFGEALAAKVRARGWARVPEWTALFVRAA